MINRSSFIKTLAVVITIGGLSVGCGPNVEVVKKQAEKEAQASFDSKRAQLNADKEKLQQKLDDTKPQVAEKDGIIMKLEQEIAEMSEPQTTESTD